MNRALAAPAAPLKEKRAREPDEERRSCTAWKIQKIRPRRVRLQTELKP